jgi:acyl-CoA hydrolase
MIRVTVDVLARKLAGEASAGGGRVFIQGGAAEPLQLLEVFEREPGLAKGLTFVGALVPGVNRRDWAGGGARSEGTFVSADWRESFEAGRFTLRPQTWFQTFGWLSQTPLDAVVMQVSPPDADGLCSLGVAADMAPAVMNRAVFKAGLINPAMPRTQGPSIPLPAFDIVAETDAPLLTYDAGGLDPAFAVIAGKIAELIPDGGVLQFGVGKVGVAALAGLAGRRGLKIHSGMVTEPLLDALDGGVLDDVLTGMAMGTPALYRRCGEDSRIRFAPSSFTHDVRVLAAIPRLVAINSSLEVDLFGQANAEFMGGRQISGIGGLTDFLRGARLSEGGVPIVALAATARGGSLSRIVPRLEMNAVSVPRSDLAVVVTEFGTADLRGLTLERRAQALIGVAAPQHRDGLEAAWVEMRRGM